MFHVRTGVDTHHCQPGLDITFSPVRMVWLSHTYNSRQLVQVPAGYVCPGEFVKHWCPSAVIIMQLAAPPLTRSGMALLLIAWTHTQPDNVLGGAQISGFIKTG